MPVICGLLTGAKFKLISKKPVAIWAGVLTPVSLAAIQIATGFFVHKAMTMIIAATGHRPDKLGGYGVGAKIKLGRLATEYLVIAKPEAVIVGMAQGWDQAVGFAAVRLGITVHAAVPFEGQESHWPPEAQGEYRSLLACCASITVVFPGGYCAYAMQLRNEWMVDRCNQLMAMWDGSPGGTANCIKYATKRGVPVVNLI